MGLFGDPVTIPGEDKSCTVMKKEANKTSFYCLGSQKTFGRKTFQNTQLCLVSSEVSMKVYVHTFYCIIPVPRIIKFCSLHIRN